MARVRYETRCGGRLLKVFDQVELPEAGKKRDEWRHVDGSHWWMVDEQRVEPDVALAMLAQAGEQP